jgi:hypothetical protein
LTIEVGYIYRNIIRTRPQDSRAVNTGALISQSKLLSSNNNSGLSNSDSESSSNNNKYSSEGEQGRSSISKYSR